MSTVETEIDNFDVTAKELRKREKFLSTGCPVLNVLLKGGIACRGITQFYGAAGVGKTQLALQMCLTVQLPVEEGGLDAGAIYICTEGVFPIRRLQEIIQNSDLSKKYNVNGDKIFVQHVSTTDEMELCVLNRIPLLMTAHKIGLVVIDTIAAPYRVEDWDEKSCNRSKSLRIVGRQLHNLCKHQDICVISINQVTAIVNCNNINNYKREQPALGITWSSMITNSIYFYRRNAKRYICTTLSPYLSEQSCNFEIHGYGIKGVN